MKITYTPLWHLIERHRQNKTSFREYLNISSATLAKLSNNEPVAMDVLGKICDAYHCTLNDILTIDPDIPPTTRWARIDDDATYSLEMLFNLSPEPSPFPPYIYGYATPFHCSKQGISDWSLRYLDDDLSDKQPDDYVVSGFLYGRDLLTFLQMAEDRSCIADILAALKIRLTSRGNLSETSATTIQETILAANVCNGSLVHRPEFLIFPTGQDQSTSQIILPLHSFSNHLAYCESLYGTEKGRLYIQQGKPDLNRLRCLKQLLSTKFPANSNTDEMARLGNFEVHTATLSQPDAIIWHILTQTTQNRTEGKVLEIILDGKLLHGDFILQISISNTQNELINTVRTVHCQDNTKQRIILNSPENITSVTLAVYQSHNNRSDAGDLIYHEHRSIIRTIINRLHIQELAVHVQGPWVIRQKKKKHPTDDTVTYYSTDTSFPPRQSTDEPWLLEEPQIKKDFRYALGEASPGWEQECHFFPADKNRPEHFVQWMKQIFAKHYDIQDVAIFDPYINAEAIEKIIHSLYDVNVNYAIFTDAFPVNSSSSKERMEELTNLVHSLDPILPSRFSLYALQKESRTLHDRFIFMTNKRWQVRAYALSNSLDGIGAAHSSIVTLCPPELSATLFEHYQNIMTLPPKEMKCLYPDKNAAQNPSVQKSAADPATAQSSTFKDFQALFLTDTSEALRKLYSMRSWNERERCIAMAREYTETINAKVYICIIRQSANSQVQLTPSHSTQLLTAQSYANTDFSLDSLEQASILYQYSFDYRPVLSVSAYEASLFLLRFFPSDFSYLWDEQANLLLKPGIAPQQIIPLYELFHALLEKESRQEIPSEHPACLMTAKSPGLRTLGAALLLKLPKSMDKLNLLNQQEVSASPESTRWLERCCQPLQNSLRPKEALLALIALLKELQIRVSQLSNSQAKAPSMPQAAMQPLIETTVQTMANTLKDIPPQEKYTSKGLGKILLPLAQRNPLDILSLTDACIRVSALSSVEASSLLTDLFNYLTDELHDTHRCLYLPKDLEQAQAIAAAIYRTNKKKAQDLHRGIKKLERTLAQRLRQAFLRSQDYTLWSSSIDHFCCLGFVELGLHDLNAEAFPISDNIAELREICRNFETALIKDSAAYRLLSQKAGW